MQAEFLKQLTIEKKEVVFNKASDEAIAYISNILNHDKLSALAGNTKVSFNDVYSGFEKEVLTLCREKIDDKEQVDFTESKVKMAVFAIVKHYIRERTLNTGKRIDDRKEKDIRSLYCEVGMLPRVHGTGLFWRGDTQVLTTVTL
jgi:polyribonucleotide nucleotidyltransferase